jgi:hypothetical protein
MAAGDVSRAMSAPPARLLMVALVAMSVEPTVLWADAGAAMAQHQNLTVLVVRQAMTLERLELLRRTTEDVVKTYGTRRARLTVVEAAAVTDVSKEVRDASAGLLRAFPAHSTATVVEGGGFRAIAGRSIMAGLTLISGQRSNNRIFGDATEAAHWIAGRLPKPDGARPLLPHDASALIAMARAARGSSEHDRLLAAMPPPRLTL